MKTLNNIVEQLHKDDTGVTKNQITQITNNFIAAIGESLIAGEEVRIVNLGKFGLTHRQPRMGRNPRTGEEVQIAARTSIKFKATATLADKVA